MTELTMIYRSGLRAPSIEQCPRRGNPASRSRSLTDKFPRSTAIALAHWPRAYRDGPETGCVLMQSAQREASHQSSRVQDNNKSFHTSTVPCRTMRKRAHGSFGSERLHRRPLGRLTGN